MMAVLLLLLLRRLDRVTHYQKSVAEVARSPLPVLPVPRA